MKGKTISYPFFCLCEKMVQNRSSFHKRSFSISLLKNTDPTFMLLCDFQRVSTFLETGWTGPLFCSETAILNKIFPQYSLLGLHSYLSNRQHRSMTHTALCLWQWSLGANWTGVLAPRHAPSGATVSAVQTVHSVLQNIVIWADLEAELGLRRGLKPEGEYKAPRSESRTSNISRFFPAFSC